jgi:hypothetical protein
MSERLSIDKMAEELGLAAVTIRRWVGLGCPHEKAPGLRGALSFDKAEVVAWMERTGATGLMGKPPAGSERVQEDDPAAGAATTDLAKIAKLTKLVHLEIKKLDAAKRKRLEKIAEGELHDRGDCERGTLQKIAAVRAGLLALPGKLSARLAGRDATTVQEELTREVIHLLAQFSGQQESAA